MKKIPAPTITSCLWFDTNGEEAVKFYASIFKDSKIGKITRYGESGSKVSGMPVGTALTIEFEIAGQKFIALNGGPVFKFTEAVSFVVTCETQEEIDYYWDNLSKDGDPKAQQCGWLKDKFGLSWQVVPAALNKYLSDPDPTKSEKVMQALIAMKKLDLDTLAQAYRQA